MFSGCIRLFPRYGGFAKFEIPATVTSSDDDASSSGSDEGHTGDGSVAEMILLDIVGARGLAQRYDSPVNPFCVVRVKRSASNHQNSSPSSSTNKAVHRTNVIHGDSDPIWAVQSKGLCILSLREEGTVEVEVRHSLGPVRSICLGRTVAIPFADIMVQNGNRVEFPLFPPPQQQSQSQRPVAGAQNDGVDHDDSDRDIANNCTSCHVHNKASLALRFRRATSQDVEFLNQENNKSILLKSIPNSLGSFSTTVQSPEEMALDVNFHTVERTSLLQNQWKIGSSKDKAKLYRILPSPDPARPLVETEWMTHEQIQAEAQKPSTRWVSAGGVVDDGGSSSSSSSSSPPASSTMGTIHLEILGCDNLPQMDMLTGQSDTFVGVVFEDNFLRTCIIWDRLSPRWMPWTTRAFSLQVRHPSSLLMLGVFDYDEMLNHDPIGRIVIHPSRFATDTTHILRYRLCYDPREEDDLHSSRASITIRMRVEWYHDKEKMVALHSPPSCLIHVDNEASYRMLSYTTRGAIDMEKPSVASVTLYGNELVSYVGNYCYFLDVLFEVLLWRGQIKVCGHQVWFPIHSAVLFAAILLSLEYPHKIVAIVLYGITWILLTIQYHLSRHPNPWKRIRSLDQKVTEMIVGGDSGSDRKRIPPCPGTEDEIRLEKLDDLKASRMFKLIVSLLRFCLKVYRVYSKQSELSLTVTTETKDWGEFLLLSERLYYLHLLLKYLCTYIRLYRNLINWKGSPTQRLGLRCFVVATVWVVLPVDRVALWVLQVCAWTFLGPWMKLVDILWVRRWYRTKEELLREVDSGESHPELDLPDFNALLQSDFFLRMGHRGRIVAEEAYKRRAMREVLLGTYSERIPVADSSRFPSVPLPESYAEPGRLVGAPREECRRVPGQEEFMLTSSIIHPTSINTT